MKLKITGIAIIIVGMLLTGEWAAAMGPQSNPSNWAKSDVNTAIWLGIVPERLQSKYQSPITREEFAELIVNTIFIREKNKAAALGKADYWTKEKLLEKVQLEVEFTDARQQHVKLAYMLGSVNGVSETQFAPNKHISRQEAATMLINTNHIINGISYTPNDVLGYTDFDKIADWALPAVQAAASVGYMKGVGKKFDYAGKFTREQSIATMMRLYFSDYEFALRGNLTIHSEYEELYYRVGKDYISVTYRNDRTASKLDDALRKAWERNDIASEKPKSYDRDKAVALFAFEKQLRPDDLPSIIAPTLNGLSTTWDYGWMNVSIFNQDSLIRFEFKPVRGYMTRAEEYQAGYPFAPVTANQIL